MSDLSITPADVLAGTNTKIDRALAGETITAGQVVYKAAATGKYLKADNNSATAEARTPAGIALNGAAANQPLAVATGGDVTLGSVLTAGAAYYLSDTAGGIVPLTDVDTAGMYYVLLGLAKSATVLALNINAPGVAVPE